MSCARSSAPVLPGASFKHPAPGYVQYQRPPVVEPIEPLVLDSGERLDGQIKYYDYGVLSVVFELPFSGEWDDSGPALGAAGFGTPTFTALASQHRQEAAGARRVRR